MQTAYTAALSASGGTGPYQWSIVSGALPVGLSLGSTTGQIIGIPTQTGTATFTAQVRDASGGAATAALSITVSTASTVSVTITTSSLPNGQQGTAYAATLVAGGGTAPYTWSISSGSLPSGLTLTASSGVISGAPTVSGTFSFTVKATDSTTPTAQSATQALSLTVAASVTAVSITTSSLSGGQQGSAYSATLAASGGTIPYTWSISSGSLPSGLTLTVSSGVISGTPTASGTFSVTVKVTDSATPTAQTATKALSLTISASITPVSITTSSLAGGTQGTAYGATLTASGGTTPYSWSVSAGALPGGLSLTASSGLISGTPTATGVFSFTAKVTDSAAHSATQSLSVTIVTAGTPVSITTSSLSNAQQGKSYSYALQAAGGVIPYTWSISAGSLPTGLSLAAATGLVSGTPTVSGTFSFTVKVTDSTTPTAQTATQALSLTVAASVTAVSITTSSLSGGQQGSAYSATLAASGGTIPYTWSISSGSLPSGLTLTASSGVISGTPTVSGTFSFTVKATDSTTPTAQSATQALSLTVAASVTAVSITTSSLSGGQQGSAYSATLAASGGTIPYTWSISSGSLPSGLTLTASSGVISGTPTASGTFSFTVQVTDSATPTAQTATKALGITVTALSTLSITTSTLSNGSQGTSYNATLAATGGNTPYTWSISSGSLPSGLTLIASSGVISGTPVVSGTFSFGVKVTDPASQSATQSLSLTVAPLKLTINSGSGVLPAGQQGTAYGATLTASGGTSPYAWSIVSGVLPVGLTLNATTGQISGIPTSTGPDSFMVQVQDSATTPQTATASLTLTVNTQGSLTLSPTNIQPATQGQNYGQANGSAPGGAVVSISGGTAPYICSVSSGSLPAGMLLTEVAPIYPSGLCMLTGIPITAGSYTFTVMVTDAALNASSHSVTFIVLSASPATFSNQSVTTTATTATFRWTTNVPTTSQVCWWNETAPSGIEGCTPEQDLGGVTSHTVVANPAPTSSSSAGFIPGMGAFYWADFGRGISGGQPADWLKSTDVDTCYGGTGPCGAAGFTLANPASSGTPDTAYWYTGQRNVMPGYPLVVGGYTGTIAGTSSQTDWKVTITSNPGLAASHMQVAWPDQQTFGACGTISTASSTNDSASFGKCNSSQSIYAYEFLVNTNVGGTTPTGTYTLGITMTPLPSGTVRTATWTFNVINSNFPAGSPSSYPAIPQLSLYQSQARTYGTQWCSNLVAPPNEQGVWYYDGGSVFQTIAGQNPTQASTWNACALSVLAQYKSYIGAQMHGNEVFPDGLYYDWTVNGNTSSKTALHNLTLDSDQANQQAEYSLPFDSVNQRENCYLASTLRLDYDAGGATTIEKVNLAMTYCLNDIDEVVNDPYYSFQTPFMAGLMAKTVINYYEDPNTGNHNDPRVPYAVKALADHIWATDWYPWNGTNGTFGYYHYLTFVGESNMGIGAGSDLQALNMLIVPMYGWLYKNTGLPQYQLEGDVIWNAGMNDDPANGIGWSGKNFSQQYRWSFDYVTWRTGP